MTPKGIAVLALLAAAACATAPAAAGPAEIRGKVVGTIGIPADARVDVYRVGPKGANQVEPLESAKPDRLGRFHTRVLPPGQYVVVFRPSDLPPSWSAARVPDDVTVVLRPAVAAGLAQLRVTAGPGVSEPLRCRMTEADPPDRVPDQREFVLAQRGEQFVRGLRPGRWRIDCPDRGATTEIVFPAADPIRELTLDPPPLGAGATLTGEVRLLDATPAVGTVVTVRPFGPGGSWEAQPWGRYGPTDPLGRYRIYGIPPGASLVRVECRQTVYRALPMPHDVAIPPSGTVELGFVIEP